MYAECIRLVVLRVVSPEEAEIVYDGPGEPVWLSAGKVRKNGQRMTSLAKLRALAVQASNGAPLNQEARQAVKSTSAGKPA